jgi:hypothetical protein
LQSKGRVRHNLCVDWSKKFSLKVLDRPGSGAQRGIATVARGRAAAIPIEVGDGNRGAGALL